MWRFPLEEVKARGEHGFLFQDFACKRLLSKNQGHRTLDGHSCVPHKTKRGAILENRKIDDPGTDSDCTVCQSDCQCDVTVCEQQVTMSQCLNGVDHQQRRWHGSPANWTGWPVVNAAFAAFDSGAEIRPSGAVQVREIGPSDVRVGLRGQLGCYATERLPNGEIIPSSKHLCLKSGRSSRNATLQNLYCGRHRH